MRLFVNKDLTLSEVPLDRATEVHINGIMIYVPMDCDIEIHDSVVRLIPIRAPSVTDRRTKGSTVVKKEQVVLTKKLICDNGPCGNKSTDPTQFGNDCPKCRTGVFIDDVSETSQSST
jgi:hypothetical protein